MNIEKSKNYDSPVALEGIGSDIKWCGRWKGGKKCLFCKHYASYNTWTNTWHWHYLLSWSDDESYPFWGPEKAHLMYKKWRGPYYPKTYSGESPDRYYTVGIAPEKIKSLLKKGCKKRKCKCVNLAQRGSWMCPECYVILKKMSEVNGVNFHDVLITDRNILKENFLTLLLSGTL